MTGQFDMAINGMDECLKAAGAAAADVVKGPGRR